MARGLILTAQGRVATTASFVARVTLSCEKLTFASYRQFPRPCRLRMALPQSDSSTRLFSSKGCCVVDHDPVDLANYKEAFSRRMAMAGLEPHHRIALGVSGGPDSMALCYLTACWKTEDPNAVGKRDGFIDGLLAIIVDHGLRTESKDEAQMVSSRVSQMGIRYEISHCTWPEGKPKQGHLQEAARDMRYQLFQNICIQHQSNVLLIAHHADDQAELFILRLSRNSGVLGLAGMAFTSQIFFTSIYEHLEFSKNEGILLVRPLLQFSKEVMYKICEGGHVKWVEDPTNRSPLYARNRIRMTLGKLSSYAFQSEVQAVISACRKTRAYVDQICHKLINQAVTVVEVSMLLTNEHLYIASMLSFAFLGNLIFEKFDFHCIGHLIHNFYVSSSSYDAVGGLQLLHLQKGYATVDLEILNPSEIEDLCLSKFIALVLQFISQRHRPVRGSALKLLLDYIRTFPCKTSVTAAGCYLCPAPGSRGTKILVCCSVDYPLPSKMELVCMHPNGERKQYFSSDLEHIIADGKLYSDLDRADVHFVDISSESVLTEAKRLNIISESTYRNILLLQKAEIKHFQLKTKGNGDNVSKNGVESVSAPSNKTLQPGQVGFFMSRFLIMWKSSTYSDNSVSHKVNSDQNLRGESEYNHFWPCKICHNSVAEVRHMVESDWLDLSKLSKCMSWDDLQQQKVHVDNNKEQIIEKRSLYLYHLRSSAQRALQLLKSVPVAARRSLPVLVNRQGLLLSIPSIGFTCCPFLMVSCVFKPRVPLGGGHSSFL